MSAFKEEWKVIKEFPVYEISNYGAVVNSQSNVILKPSFTPQGALKVGLFDGAKQHTRSVKVLVAEAFVQGRSSMFDTAMLLDGDQSNCVQWNIVWRPRWFAWQYARQFEHIPEFLGLGPITELDKYGRPMGQYTDLVQAAITNGLLFSDMWRGIHTTEPIAPFGQRFCFTSKLED